MVNRMGIPPTEKPIQNNNNEFDLNTFSNWHVIIASNRGPVVNMKRPRRPDHPAKRQRGIDHRIIWHYPIYQRDLDLLRAKP